jgi:3-deoxy-7-phosphoheptulonate synthase
MPDTNTRDVNVLKTEQLISPADLVAMLPVTPEAEQTVVQGRRDIQAILHGEDSRFLVIAGPCSIHDEKAAREYARNLAEISEKVSDRMVIVMRVYFEKPRTTVGWKGLLYDPHLNDTFDIGTGLKMGRKLLLDVAEMGLPTATEFLDPIVPQYLADLISWVAIGARTTESQTHRQMASGLSMPVGFKNGTNGSTKISVDAMVSARAPHGFLGIDQAGRTSVVHTAGNQYGHLVLRGANDGPNFDAGSVATAQQELEEGGVPSQLLIDCSHGNCNKDHTKMHVAFESVIEQRVRGNIGIIGAMLESNINPGSQKINGDPSKMEYGVSITDECIGWEETARLLNWAYDRLG